MTDNVPNPSRADAEQVMQGLLHVDWSRIPEPKDDGAADHLEGRVVPSVVLPSTHGGSVDLSKLKGRTLLYVYPMTAKPDGSTPDGWDQIPGARGCTPQACAFRDHALELRKLGVQQLFGASTQVLDDLREASERLHLPYPLLSDSDLCLQQALELPELSVDGSTLLKRLTLVLEDDRIVRCFYPVFPPDEAPKQVALWLRSRRNAERGNA